MKRGLILLIFVLFNFYLSAQDKECGMEAHMHEMMKDPEFARQWKINQEKFKKTVRTRINSEFGSMIMDPVVIPVAVHFPEGQESDRVCLEALAQNQIDILNGDFTATNPDANLWTTASAFYPDVVHGAANVQFCIATALHPEDTDDDLVEGGPAVTIGYNFGGGNDADPAWSGYMNFLVKDIGGGLLGYSPLGGNINAGQSVVINLGAFGSGAGCPDSGIVPGAPYNLGRTVTHELGHFYNLQHPFSGSCASDDGIADTPNISDANYGCPSPGTVAGCETGEFALTMSYMDYGDDSCLYMFSEGQTNVVDDYVSAVLQSQFKPGTIPVCVEVPQYIMSNDSVTTCNGLFYDSGGPADGPDPGDYSNNEVYTFTICPEISGQSTQLQFTEFSTQNNTDVLTIYNAADASDPATIIGEFSGDNSPETIAATLTNTSGCLTLVFTSNGFQTDTGWLAFISCVDPPAECQTILSQLDSASPEPNADGIITVCVGEEITLTGSGQFSEPGGGLGAAYQWDTGDGTTISGQTVTFSFDEPGVYIANLNIWDTNTSVFPEGCKSTNEIDQIIWVSTTPLFSATDDTLDPLCFGNTSTITPVVTPVQYLNECTPPESDVTFLPDGSGVSYETSIIVDCFDTDLDLTDAGQISQVCLVLEHSYLGDLDIELISPSGQVIFLQTQGGGSANLGEPWATSTVDGSSNNTTPGVGYQYCFVPDNSFPTLTAGVQSGGTFISGDGPNTYTDSFVPAGTYASVDSFDALVGSSLNGSWTIRITDNIGADNGYIFAWTLDFDESILPSSLSFTPEIVSGEWEGDEPTIIDINGDVITITPDGEGQFCYTYTVIDNFGCQYSDEICINVLPELVHDPPNDLFICDPVTSPGLFNLFQNEAVVLAPNNNPDDFIVTFHNSSGDAENDINPIANLSTYEGLDEEIIFIRFEYLDSNCYEIETFQLNLLDAPDINVVGDLVLCDDVTNDGIESFDLEGQTVNILGTQSATDYVVSYHLNDDDADLGQNILSSPYENISNPQPIYVRVQAVGGSECYVASKDPVFNLIVTNQASATDPGDLTLCDVVSPGDFIEEFDLESQTPIILGTQDPATFTLTYHISQEDADSGDSPLTSPYTSASQTIFVRVEESGLPACYATIEFDLIVDPIPLTTLMTPLEVCDDDADGLADFTLTDKDTEALNGQTGLSVSYYATESDAEAGTPEIGPVYTNITVNTEQVWIRLTNIAADCYSVMPLDLVVNPLPVPELAVVDPLCDDDTDGLQTFDLSGVASQVIGIQLDMDVTYHQTQSDAQDGVNALGDNITTTTPDLQTIFIRLENTITNCYSVSTIDLVVDPLPTIPAIAPYVLCDEINSGDLEEEFDLSVLDIEVINGQDATVSYYATEADAQNNVAPLATLYSSPTQVIFAALQDNITGCRAVAPIELIVVELPSTTLLTPLEVCDDDADGLADFTLTDKDTEALNGQTGLSVSYYATESDAEAGTPEIGPVYTNITVNTEQVWIRLTNIAADCYSVMPLDLVVNPLPVPELAVVDPLCDDDTDGLQTFDLSGVASQVIGIQLDMDVTYHQTQSDAQDGVNALGDNITTTTPDLQTIFIRLENTITNCYSVSTIDLVVNSLPVVELEDNYVICEDASGGGLDYAIVDPGLSSVTYSFIWRDESGVLISTDPTYTVQEPGIYSLEVSYTDGSGCTAPLEIFTVNESGNPAVTASVTSEPFADTHVIVATATGTGIYEFSLDQGPWQDSGTFIGVSSGEHSVNVRDVNGCGVTTYVLFVIDFPPYFTPNGDGYNDVWNISALSGQMASKIYIFDRYGKLLKQISPAGDGWDGTYNGQRMPTSDYWFLLEYNDFNTGEPKQLRAHFTLKR